MRCCVAGADRLWDVLIARVSHHDEVSFAAINGDRVDLIDTHPFGEIHLTGESHPLDSVRLLAPILPSKVIAVGKNYADHAAEMGGEVPAQPMIFLKPSTSVIGPAAPIVLPASSHHVDLEAELAVVIGRMCRHVPLDRVDDVILGYTCANDVSARDHQASDGQWGRAKGFDTFCPLGPWIATDVSPGDLAITGRVNGEVRQSARTSSMVRDVAALVSWISGVMTLLPGDVILTGTPAGVSPIVAGDEVVIDIEGIGELRNPVVAEEDHS
jgi:2-keto-4-pentenoate hydratase/2-oxohepta-3-ene-1,7-dioic acid hydratase in catechol pathway